MVCQQGQFNLFRKASIKMVSRGENNKVDLTPSFQVNSCEINYFVPKQLISRSFRAERSRFSHSELMNQQGNSFLICFVISWNSFLIRSARNASYILTLHRCFFAQNLPISQFASCKTLFEPASFFCSPFTSLISSCCFETRSSVPIIIDIFSEFTHLSFPAAIAIGADDTDGSSLSSSSITHHICFF